MIELTYGELPSYDVFNRQVDLHVPKGKGRKIEYLFDVTECADISYSVLAIRSIRKRNYEILESSLNRLAIVISNRKALYKFIQRLMALSQKVSNMADDPGKEDSISLMKDSVRVIDLVDKILYDLDIEWG